MIWIIYVEYLKWNFSPYHTETSPLIYFANQWTGFYMIDASIMKELNLLPLDHSMSLASFYTPWKHQKTSGFLMFSGGIERDQWHEMGQL